MPDPNNASGWRRAAATLLVAGLATLLLLGLLRSRPLVAHSLTPAILLQIFGIVLLLCILAPRAAGWADRIGGRPQPEPDEAEGSVAITANDPLFPEERRELERTVEQMRERLAQTTVSRDYLSSVLNSMADAVFVSDPAGMIRISNDAAWRLTGFAENQLRGRFVGALIENTSGVSLPLLLHHARQSGETVIRTQAGQTIPVSFSGSDINIGDPELAGSIYVLRDITERKRSERRIRYLARYDALTKIPNRMQFQHLLQQAIARSLRSGHCIALLYLDMDRFKEINDTFGHGAGDRVLETLSERVSRVLPAGAAFGRLAGDEFAVLVDGLQRHNARSAVKQIGATILHSVGNDPVQVADQEIFLTVSIGAALCPDDTENVIDLIRNADAAMYRSKQNGGNSCVFYEPEMNAAVNERLVLKSKLKRAVERDELVIRYLPKVDLTSGRIVGAEALLRWLPPGHGEVPPSLFIPLAEQSNLISDVGEWVLNRVCLEYGTLADRVQDPGRIALNLSLRQLRQASFILQCRSVFERHAVDPQNLELEITETTLMADPKRIIAMLRELRGMGLHLAIDDFGTGYSSLSALRQFPIGTLKIDQSFVRGAALSQGEETLVRTIIEMGRSLGMDVVAEGVETTAQLATLRRLGCHFAQGLLFGEPCTVDGLGALLTEQELGISPYAVLFERTAAAD